MSQQPEKRRNGKFRTARRVFIAVVVIVVLIPLLWLGFPFYTARTVEITVTGKERVPDGEDGSYYLVFTEDEVFKNVDVWRRLKTASSDLQGRLREGRRFEVVVYGWRIPILSTYRNIASIQSEITPAMIDTDSLGELKPRIEKAAETKLPTAVLYRREADPRALARALNAEFADVTVRVFGEESAGLWGMMIYWDPSKGVILEATPLPDFQGDGTLEWGPE